MEGSGAGAADRRHLKQPPGAAPATMGVPTPGGGEAGGRGECFYTWVAVAAETLISSMRDKPLFLGKESRTATRRQM